MDEVEKIVATVRMMRDRIERLERELEACLAREKTLRKALLLEQDLYYKRGEQHYISAVMKNALAMPFDDMALQILLAGNEEVWSEVAAKWRTKAARAEVREKLLLDALEEICNTACGDGTRHVRLACKALDTPPDDTALKDVLAEERERCIDVCSATLTQDHNIESICEAIRALGDEE